MVDTPTPSRRRAAFAIAMHKGGVGKTATAVNLAVAFAALGRRVLVLDLDAQGNASTLLGYDRAQIMRGTYDLLLGRANLHTVAHPTAIPGLFLAPASIDLLGIEPDLGDVYRAQHRLIAALDDSSLEVDMVIADCPPAYGVLTLNALIAATAVLMPVEAGSFALEELEQILRTVNEVKHNDNHSLRHGVVLSLADPNAALTARVEEAVRAQMGDRVFRTVLPRDVTVAEAAFERRPVLLHDPQAPASRAYLRLAAEILWRDDQAARGRPVGGWTHDDGDLLPAHAHADFDALAEDCAAAAAETLKAWRDRRPGDPLLARPSPILPTLPEAVAPAPSAAEADDGADPMRGVSRLNAWLAVALGVSVALGLIIYLLLQGTP